jgi:hypothetical protein
MHWYAVILLKVFASIWSTVAMMDMYKLDKHKQGSFIGGLFMGFIVIAGIWAC